MTFVSSSGLFSCASKPLVHIQKLFSFETHTAAVVSSLCLDRKWDYHNTASYWFSYVHGIAMRNRSDNIAVTYAIWLSVTGHWHRLATDNSSNAIWRVSRWALNQAFSSQAFNLNTMWYCVDLWDARCLESHPSIQVTLLCLIGLQLISLVIN